ncbi:helix-turn-helix domain-containing protein [Streptomyces sp. NPDC001978]|uniref:helix-turn-helix domain-containing protein n=1 Tax=Streptomyces sp. NPDC001978 TaxID=3364627 RepID=UPI0036A102E0
MADEEEATPTVGKVVGENLKTMRQQQRLTQADAAAVLVRTGLAWRRTHLSDLESGRRETVDLGTLVVLGQALDVRLQDFFAGDGDVLLTPRAEYPDSGAMATRAQLRDWLSGGEAGLTVMGSQNVRAALEHFSWQGREIPIEADLAFAERMGVTVQEVVKAAERIWRGSLTEERDRRVAALGDLPIQERQAKQGHITRQLTSILAKQMDFTGEAGDG